MGIPGLEWKAALEWPMEQRHFLCLGSVSCEWNGEDGFSEPPLKFPVNWHEAGVKKGVIRV